MQEFKGQITCNVGAKRMWRAACEDPHVCLPKAVPNALKRIEYEGSPLEPGSVRTVYYQQSYAERVSKENRLNHLVEYTKEKTLKVDDNSLTVKMEVIEGGFLGILVTYYNYEVHFVEGALPDTCIAQLHFQYRPISPKHHPMMRERLKEVLPRSIQGLETYLLANDDYQD